MLLGVLVNKRSRDLDLLLGLKFMPNYLMYVAVTNPNLMPLVR